MGRQQLLHAVQEALQAELQGQTPPPGGIKNYAPMSAFAVRSRILSTRLMVSRPLRGLVKKMFFSRADAIDLLDHPMPPATA